LLLGAYRLYWTRVPFRWVYPGCKGGWSMDVFGEALLVALGVLDYSRERVKQAVDKLRQQGELSREQADKLIEELRERGRQERGELQKKVASVAKKARSALLFATHDDLKKVERRLSKLEKSVQALVQSAEKTQDA